MLRRWGVLPVLLGRRLLRRITLRRWLLARWRIAAVLARLRRGTVGRLGWCAWSGIVALGRLSVVALTLRWRRLLILALGGVLPLGGRVVIARLAVGRLAVALVGHFRSSDST